MWKGNGAWRLPVFEIRWLVSSRPLSKIRTFGKMNHSPYFGQAALSKALQADICDSDSCKSACAGVSRVLHQAALGSVPRSIDAPEVTDAANVGGFVKMMAAAREAGGRRFVYASSSAVYGDDPSVAKSEDRLGAVLSRYALSKLVNEQYAAVFARCYGLNTLKAVYRTTACTV